MGGRDFPVLAGVQPPGALADPVVLARLVARGTMAIPSFGANDGQFPGSARAGADRRPRARNRGGAAWRLPVLYLALLTVACVDLLDPARPWVLDGSFLRDPAMPGWWRRCGPGRETQFNPEGYGMAAGAALLCGRLSRGRPARIALHDARNCLRTARPDRLCRALARPCGTANC